MSKDVWLWCWKVSFELLKELGKEKRWEEYEKLIVELEKNSKNLPQLIKPYDDLRKIYQKLQVRSKVEALNMIFPKG